MKLIQRMFIKQLLAVLISCVVAVVFYIVALSVQVNTAKDRALHTESIDETITRFQQYKQIEQRLSSASTLALDQPTIVAIDNNLNQVNALLLVVERDSITYLSKSLAELNKEYILTQIIRNSNEVRLGSDIFELYNINLADNNYDIYFLYEEPKRLSVSNIAFIIAAATFFITYVICCLYIMYRLNRKFIGPILKLKDAAVKISEGELDSIISLDTQDEVDDLAKSLEFLRIKLKEAILLQKKYDDNRSFLISSISHDLRTPVTTIKGYVEALRDGIAHSPEKEKQYLHIIDKKANQINEMIEDLLLYSKLDLNQVPFTFTKVNIVNYLQDGIEEYTHFFSQHNVKVSFNHTLTDNYELNLDLNRFMRVIQNIWNNAIVYNNNKHKNIDISIRETFTSIVIEVQDNGKGLDSDESKRIFEKFYRNDRARQSEQGSGLGLAIAKHIIDEHQGRIWAKGILGEGTSIFISLPKIKE